MVTDMVDCRAPSGGRVGGASALSVAVLPAAVLSALALVVVAGVPGIVLRRFRGAAALVDGAALDGVAAGRGARLGVDAGMLRALLVAERSGSLPVPAARFSAAPVAVGGVARAAVADFASVARLNEDGKIEARFAGPVTLGRLFSAAGLRLDSGAAAAAALLPLSEGRVRWLAAVMASPYAGRRGAEDVGGGRVGGLLSVLPGAARLEEAVGRAAAGEEDAVVGRFSVEAVEGRRLGGTAVFLGVGGLALGESSDLLAGMDSASASGPGSGVASWSDAGASNGDGSTISVAMAIVPPCSELSV